MANIIQAEIEPHLAQFADGLYNPLGHVEEMGLEKRYAAFLIGQYGTLDDSELALAIACDYIESGHKQDQVRDLALEHGVGLMAITGKMRELNNRAIGHATELISMVRGTVPGENLTLATADLLARETYGTKTRRTERPYYLHPFEVASMSLDAILKLRSRGYDITNERADAILAVDLNHDGTEEASRDNRFFNPNRLQTFSPLLLRWTLEMTDNPYGQEAADATRLLTHYNRKIQPWVPTYREYIQLGSSVFMFDLVKFADVKHNYDIEPKPPKDEEDREKIEARREDYEWALPEIELAIEPASINSGVSSDVGWGAEYVKIVDSNTTATVIDLAPRLRRHINGESSVAA